MVGAATSGSYSLLQLRAGLPRGIHFCQEEGSSRESLLPWDVAIAMSLVPVERRRRAYAR